MHGQCVFDDMFVCIITHIGVDLGVTDSKRTPLVQQDATVSRALMQILLVIRTFRGVGLLITAMETHAGKWRIN